MWRAGRQFEVKVPQTLELTAEEVEAFQNDNRFVISEASEATGSEDSSDETTSSDSDSQDGAGDGDETTEEDTTSEDEASEDSSSDSEEEASDETTEAPQVSNVDDLVKNNSRNELNAKALELGVETPEREDWNKLEVAQAIVEAEARNTSEATS
jgi:virulence-associated protein VagC